MSSSYIEYCDFSFNGDIENKKKSTAHITNYELLSPNGHPIPNGMYDLRLGTIDHNHICLSCSNGKKLCPGHRGHHELRTCILQPLGGSEVRKFLRIICFNCGANVVDKEKFIHAPLNKRLTEASSVITEGKACPECSTPHPRIVKDEGDYFTYYAESALLEKKPRGKIMERKGDKLYPDIIRTIFDKISDKTLELLGRNGNNHPRKLILSIIEIPPNTIRPGVKSFTGGGSSYHDSTNLLQNLIKRNSQLPEKLPDAMTTYMPGAIVEPEIDRAVQNLQQIYYDLIMGSSSTSAVQGNSGKRGLIIGSRPVHSFMRNLTGKEGRIRGNLLGKRVYYISRSTISGNMKFRIDQVGIPLDFARILQVKETVQAYNHDWLMSIFLNGKKQYPGCTHIIKKSTGEMHDVAGLRSDYFLEIGDIIFRDVINGDLAFFNRQPTLEKSGIGVHKVIIIQDPSIHTFQMNVIACDWYNADFDGDQMNLWIAREPAARAEARIMSSVSNLFISTKTSGPVNGQVQDSLVGCYELTREEVRLDKYHAMSLFSAVGMDPPRFDIYPSNHIFTGRDIISILLTTNQTPINYTGVPQTYSDVYIPFLKYHPSETITIIKAGKMISGVLDKKSIGGKKNGSLFHIIGRDYGPQKALEMIYLLQQIALKFLMFNGFTVGTADLLPNTLAIDQIHALVASVELESTIITDKLVNGQIIPPIDSDVNTFYEKLQINALKVNEHEILRWVLNSIKPESNGFFKMISAGSKGTNPNLINVSGVIGQTTINGDRIKEQFAYGRTLPYFPRFATEPAAFGFVKNSYINGMTSSEYIFQGMNGRFDLINKALSTASTGYFMRKGVMNNQSSLIDNHRHVVKDTKIIQMIYGEDGLDSRELEMVKFTTIEMNNEKLREFAYITAGLGRQPLGSISGDNISDDNISDDNTTTSGRRPRPAARPATLQIMIDAAFAKIVEDRDKYRKIFISIDNSNFGQLFSTSLLIPVNIHKIILGLETNNDETITVEKLQRIIDLYENIAYTLINEIQENNKSYIPNHKKAAAEMLCISIRAELNPKRLSKLNNQQISYIIDIIRYKYSLALIDYGSAVGILAAQAISEPLTQYMLDSHHRSVAGGTNKSGLVRVNEIYGAKDVSKEQSSAMQLMLQRSVTDIISAQKIANVIEFVILKDFVKQYDILLEPNTECIFPDYKNDRKWMEAFEESHPLVQKPTDITNWCYRFIINKANLVLKAIDLELIIRQIRLKFSGIYLTHTAEAVSEIVIRLWPRNSQFKRTGDNESKAIIFLEDLLDTPIRGIRGIIRAVPKKVSKFIVNNSDLIKEDRYVINTVGTNLYNALLHTAIDETCAISTSIGDTYKLYGIEAARSKIIYETVGFMEDNTPNLRHLYIYADEMTRTGKVTSLERGGLSLREHNNVLLRAAYGSPIQVFQESILAGAKSKVTGISGPQLLGAIPQIGTIYNTLLVNEEFVKANTVSIDSLLDDL